MIRRLFALLVLAALVAGGLYYWKARSPELRAPESLRDVSRTLQDTALTGAVKTAFGLNKNLKPLPLDVHTDDHVVTLRGPVSTQDLKDIAERVAKAVPDVEQVVNHIRVTGGPAEPPRPDRTLTEALDDQALEMQVRLALSLNRDLNDASLEVEAFKRSVTLSGKAPTAGQRTLAVQVARDTPGVSGVTDRIQVLDRKGGAPRP
jgi:hyperosmotically inducible periplasmic protein